MSSDGLVRCDACGRGVRHTDVADVNIPVLLRGDSFFEYKCEDCTGTGSDAFVRGTLSWPTIVQLILYHLHVTQPSRRFFALREDICSLIDKCWDYLQSPDRVRPVTWMNSVAATLSTKQTFLSGTVELGMNGFWALRSIEPPMPVRHGQPARARTSVSAASSNAPQTPPAQAGSSSSSPSVSETNQPTAARNSSSATHAKTKRYTIPISIFASGSARTTPVSAYWPKRSAPSASASKSTGRSKTKPKRSITSSFAGNATDTDDDQRHRSRSDKTPSKRPKPKNQIRQPSKSISNRRSINETDDSEHTESGTSSPSRQTSESSSQSDSSADTGSESASNASSSTDHAYQTRNRKRSRRESDGSLVGPRFTSGPFEAARTRIYRPRRLEKQAAQETSSAPSPTDADAAEHLNAIEQSDIQMSSLTSSSILDPLASTSSASSSIKKKSLDAPSRLSSKQPQHENAKQSSNERDPNADRSTASASAAHASLSKPSSRKSNGHPTQESHHHALDEKPQNGDRLPTMESIKESTDALKRHADASQTRLLPRLLSAQQEFDIKARLDLAAHLLPPALRRFRRKLLLRAEKRVLGHRALDIDAWMNRYARESLPGPTPIVVPPELQLRVCMSDGVWRGLSVPGMTPSQVMIRYNQAQEYMNIPRAQSMHARLHGRDPRLRNTLACLESRVSAFTGRRLEPYILRDVDSTPPQMLILESIRSIGLGLDQTHNRGSCRSGMRLPVPMRSSIDYVYFHESLLSDVNDVLSRVFWPGIDVCESLLFPDFGVIALYKRLVVGCAFMTPEGYITYLMVRPGWDQSGIASRMLFHLIQKAKSMSHDVTLHVAADNPAMILYQKFGFKPEGFVVGFYDKYLPSTMQCTNAIFARLRLR